MPYTLTIENKVIRIVMTGRFTAEDLLALTAEMQVLEQNAAVVPHRITDMTGIEELVVHHPALSVLVAKRKALHFPNAFKSAIIARANLHVGYARMFQNLNDNPQITIRIFLDEATAVGWITDAAAGG